MEEELTFPKLRTSKNVASRDIEALGHDEISSFLFIYFFLFIFWFFDRLYLVRFSLPLFFFYFLWFVCLHQLLRAFTENPI